MISRKAFSRFLADYGMLLALLLLCAYYSLATLEEQHPTGAAAGHQLAEELIGRCPRGARVLIVAPETSQDAEFAEVLREQLAAGGLIVTDVVKGHPPETKKILEKIAKTGGRLDFIACNHVSASWGVFDDLPQKIPALAGVKLVKPASYRWPNFLKTTNLLNVANQIAVIAIVAIGMTLVIIAAGIDLSVGSLIALSAVVVTLLIRDWGGAEQAPNLNLVLCSLAAIIFCAGIGLISGVLVTFFEIPAFIATLAMMLVASGLAFIFAKGQSVYQVPESFIWLGRGADLGIPNAVLLMLILYALADVLMTRTAVGRHIYAVGGNKEAARLSGVAVTRVLLFVYTVCGALAGLGGIVMASQLKSGAPTYGQMYELYVIAAVVVGGTSLTGGEGKILGTLIGAFIIAVIQNGMNLTGVESYTQKVILGLVILGAVLLDMFKRRGFAVAARWRSVLLAIKTETQSRPHPKELAEDTKPT